MTVEDDGLGPAAILWSGDGTGTFAWPSQWSNGLENAYPLVTGDFNGDGKIDMASRIGSSGIRPFVGLGSGDLRDFGVYQHFGSIGAMAVADFDQDGFDDLAMMRDTFGRLTIRLSRPRLVSGYADWTWISPWKSESHHVAVQLGPSYKDYPFLFLGSLSGWSPGIQLGGFQVQLNPDAYTTFLFNNPNTLIQDSWGTLNSLGGALASFNAGGAPVDPGLLGLVFHHAFLVLDPQTLAPVWVSKAFKLEIKSPFS